MLVEKLYMLQRTPQRRNIWNGIWNGWTGSPPHAISSSSLPMLKSYQTVIINAWCLGGASVQLTSDLISLVLGEHVGLNSFIGDSKVGIVVNARQDCISSCLSCSIRFVKRQWKYTNIMRCVFPLPLYTQKNCVCVRVRVCVPARCVALFQIGKRVCVYEYSILVLYTHAWLGLTRMADGDKGRRCVCVCVCVCLNIDNPTPLYFYSSVLYYFSPHQDTLSLSWPPCPLIAFFNLLGRLRAFHVRSL